LIRTILSTGSLWLLDTAYVFELAAEAGFDGIEVMCDQRFTTRSPAYLQRLSEEYGLPIPVLHTPFSADALGWGNSDTELGRVRHTLKLAEKLQAETIVVHLPLRYGWASLRLGDWQARLPWFGGFEDIRSWIEKGELAELQAKTDVHIAIENMPTKQFWGRAVNPAYWNTMEAWSVVHDHLTLDTTHWGTFGLDPTAALQMAAERVRHVHLSNYAGGREHRLPQTGELDLEKFLQTLARTDFEGAVSVEVHPDALAFDTPKATRRKLGETLAFCRLHLQQPTA